MHPISRQTYELIDRLYEPNSPLRRLFRLRPDTVELIAQIGAAGEPASIPYLLLLVLSTDTIAAAAAALDQVMEALPVLDLVPLDRWARETGAYWNDLSARFKAGALNPQRLALPATPAAPGRAQRGRSPPRCTGSSLRRR